MDKKVINIFKKKCGEGNNMDTAIATRRDSVIAKSCPEFMEDKLLTNLKDAGARLSDSLNINKDHIYKAIRKARNEWK